jgi:hypothetical protein
MDREIKCEEGTRRGREGGGAVGSELVSSGTSDHGPSNPTLNDDDMFEDHGGQCHPFPCPSQLQRVCLVCLTNRISAFEPRRALAYSKRLTQERLSRESVLSDAHAVLITSSPLVFVLNNNEKIQKFGSFTSFLESSLLDGEHIKLGAVNRDKFVKTTIKSLRYSDSGIVLGLIGRVVVRSSPSPSHARAVATRLTFLAAECSPRDRAGWN